MLQMDHLGDLASIAGLLLGLVGFTATIIGVWRSRKSAQRAQEAAEEARQAVMRSQTISDVSSAVTRFEEIKRLHRVKAWQFLPDQYSRLRLMLVAVRTTSPDLTNKERATIQGAVQHLSDMEKLVEKSIGNSNEIDGPKLNSIISTQMEKLTEVLETLKSK